MGFEFGCIRVVEHDSTECGPGTHGYNHWNYVKGLMYHEKLRKETNYGLNVHTCISWCLGQS